MQSLLRTHCVVAKSGLDSRPYGERHPVGPLAVHSSIPTIPHDLQTEPGNGTSVTVCTRAARPELTLLVGCRQRDPVRHGPAGNGTGVRSLVEQEVAVVSRRKASGGRPKGEGEERTGRTRRAPLRGRRYSLEARCTSYTSSLLAEESAGERRVEEGGGLYRWATFP